MIRPLFGTRPPERQRSQQSHNTQAHNTQMQDLVARRQAQSASAFPSAQDTAIIPSILASIRQRMQRLRDENPSFPADNVRFWQLEQLDTVSDTSSDTELDRDEVVPDSEEDSVDERETESDNITDSGMFQFENSPGGMVFWVPWESRPPQQSPQSNGSPDNTRRRVWFEDEEAPER